MASTQGPDIVYSDRWLTLYSGGNLVVYNYYFPTMSSRTLHLPRIKSIATGTALNLTLWKFKVWGILPTPIYWALDWDRGKLQLQGRSDEIRKRCVVITTDEGWFHHVGVTCDDIEKFLSEVEKMGVEVLRKPIERHSHSE